MPEEKPKPLSRDAQAVYTYLIRSVIPTRRVITYADVHAHTGVAYGEAGGYIGRVLGEIFEGCDAHALPPLTSVVARQAEAEHGLPGLGYFRALAASENHAKRRLDPGIERWQHHTGINEFDPDISRWAYREMIAEHQASVWQRTAWPRTL